VAPWDLAKQPMIWRDLALHAEAVEGEAHEALQNGPQPVSRQPATQQPARPQAEPPDGLTQAIEQAEYEQQLARWKQAQAQSQG
jgi:hypothetical protein